MGLRGLHRAEKPATSVSLVQRTLNRRLARHAEEKPKSKNVEIHMEEADLCRKSEAKQGEEGIHAWKLAALCGQLEAEWNKGSI